MKNFVLTLFLLILSSCSDDRLSGDPSQSLIDGHWETDCYAEGEQWKRSSYLFSYAEVVTRKDQYYSDECQTALYDANYSGRYELAVTWTPYVHRMEIWVEQSQLELFDASLLGKSSLCGVDSWQLGTPVDGASLHGENCLLKFSSNFYYQSLFSIKENFISAALDFGPVQSEGGGDEIDAPDFEEIAVQQRFSRVF